jgi:hypothetical protein
MIIIGHHTIPIIGLIIDHTGLTTLITGLTTLITGHT